MLAQLRANAAIARHAAFKRESVMPARSHVQIVRPVSKQNAKMGRRVRTLKVRNWQIEAAHFN